MIRKETSSDKRYPAGAESGNAGYEDWVAAGVEAALADYVMRAILPRYQDFDKGHRQEHILQVIAQSMKMLADRSETRLCPSIVFAAAAFHDLGLTDGREFHHLSSGKIVREDTRLPQWFRPEEIETIAQAVEDHRASSKVAPRSLYGCLLAEADRSIEPADIVRRTLQYGLSHYPDLDDEAQWRRCYAHLLEKYGDGGYLKLWWPDSPNAAGLEELRRILRNEPEARRLYEGIKQAQIL